MAAIRHSVLLDIWNNEMEYIGFVCIIIFYDFSTICMFFSNVIVNLNTALIHHAMEEEV